MASIKQRRKQLDDARDELQAKLNWTMGMIAMLDEIMRDYSITAKKKKKEDGENQAEALLMI